MLNELMIAHVILHSLFGSEVSLGSVLRCVSGLRNLFSHTSVRCGLLTLTVSDTQAVRKGQLGMCGSSV